MKIETNEVAEFALFDDFREVLSALRMDDDTTFHIHTREGSVVTFEANEWNWFLSAARKGYKLLVNGDNDWE